ncbi:MAG: hypothetical protein ACRD0G_02505 [Acidimicrobiales bacterium]
MDLHGLEPTERFSVAPGDVRALDETAIHTIQPGGGEYLGALHIYGGDLLATPRSSWRGGVEGPYDEAGVLRLFDHIRRREGELGRPMTADETTALLAANAATLASPGAGKHSQAGTRCSRSGREP